MLKNIFVVVCNFGDTDRIVVTYFMLFPIPDQSEKKTIFPSSRSEKSTTQAGKIKNILWLFYTQYC